MGYIPIEEQRVYTCAEELADRLWEIVGRWPHRAQRTVGDQFNRAVDSIGANIAEASGRYHPGEMRHFLYYARGSLREANWWLRRAQKRALVSAEEHEHLSAELEKLSMMINKMIAHQRGRIAEPAQSYTVNHLEDGA